MKFICEKQSCPAMASRVLIMVTAIVCCVMANVKASGLDGLCGFTAGEMRKDGKIGDLEQIEVKLKKPFRKFKRVGLKYSKSGRLAELYAVAQLGNLKPAAAKREFEEVVNYLQKANVRENRLEGSTGWVGDKGGYWHGNGLAKIKDTRLQVRVDVYASYIGPKEYDEMYGKNSSSGVKPGWTISIGMEWHDVDIMDLDPGTTARRTNPKISVKKFVEQTFRTHFKSAFPSDYYPRMMQDLKSRHDLWWFGWKDEDGDASSATFLVAADNLPPFNDVTSPHAQPVHVPGTRWEYGRYLTKPVCQSEKVLFAYSNLQDRPGAKVPVNRAEDLSLSAIVLRGKKDVQNVSQAAVKFCNGVETWLRIKFSETNVTEKATSMTFREGELVVTAIVEPHVDTRVDNIDNKGRKQSIEYSVVISDGVSPVVQTIKGEILTRMRSVVIPSIDFSPNGRKDTLRDAIDFLSKESKEHDDSGSPDGVGIDIVLSDNTLGLKPIPRIHANGIRLYDALTLVCSSVGLGFEVYGGRVNVTPNGKSGF